MEFLKNIYFFLQCVRFTSGSKLYTTIAKVLNKVKGSLLTVAALHLLVVIVFTNIGYLVRFFFSLHMLIPMRGSTGVVL